MATLLVGAAINIGASILINKFFGPEGQDVTQEGPRLSDLTVTSSAPGQVRPQGFGSIRLGGNNIWSTGIREIVRENRQDGPGKGGGGGGSVTTRTYEYRADFAIGFGVGEAEEIVELWFDSKLVYDASGETTGLGKYRFRFYPGNETQLPDPLIEADVDGRLGAGSTPAYRGECYIVFQDVPLADFGNRIPNVSALIAFKSTAQKLTRTVTLSQIPGTGATGGTSIGMYNPRDDTWYVSEDTTGQTYSIGGQYEISDESGSGDSRRARMFGPDNFHYRDRIDGNVSRWRKIDPYTDQLIYVFAGGGVGRASQPNWCGVMRVDVAGLPRPVTVQFVNDDASGFGIDTGRAYIEAEDGESNSVLRDVDELTDADRILWDPYRGERVWWTQETTGETTVYEAIVVPVIDILGNISVDVNVVTVATITKGGVDIPGTGNINGWCWLPIQNALVLSYATGIVKLDLDTGTITDTNLDVSFDCEAQWSDTELFAWGESGGDFITISTADLSVVDRETVASFFPGENSQWNEQNSTYIPATHSVIACRAIGTSGSTPSAAQVFLKRTIADGADLADVVSKLCQDAGLDASDIDVTDLVGETVRGFVVNRQTPLKEALRPLANAFLFDFVESDFKVKFVKRGGALALAQPIPAEDIGLASTSDRTGPFQERRSQEVELPLRVQVNFADVDQDYQQGSEADRRQRNPSPTIGSDSELELNLPIALNSDEARAIAQEQLYISWTERRSIETQLTQEYLLLDPGDSVEMELDTETVRVRLTRVEVGADFTLSLSAVVEDEDNYASNLPGSASESFEPQKVPDRAPTRFFALNSPLLRDQDAAVQQFSRAYAAISGQSDRWPGGSLMRSKDQGATWQELFAQSVPVPWGVVQGALPDPDSFYTWNPDQSFTVSMLVGGDTLETRTELEVLNGANTGAICRRDGTLEVVQWRDVTDNGDGTFELSYLLRASRGTEEEAVNHNNGEFFVVLGLDVTSSLRLELDEINSNLLFRPVTTATLIEDAANDFATYTGRDLKPYSPASLEAVTDGGGNVDIDWIRRTRYSGQLRDGTDEVPLNEQFERFEIDILDPTLTVTAGSPYTVNDATSFEYTTAQQASDGISASDNITIRVYQISAIVGRGSVAEITHVV